MALIERDATMSKLDPYLKDVPAAFRRAWGRTRKCDPLDLLAQSKTTKAGLMRDYSVDELRKLWAENSNVYADEFGQQFLFVIEQSFAIRVKKADYSSCSRNYPTDQDLNYRGQGLIEGLPSSHNLELVYVLNPTETEIRDVRVVCLNGDEPYWWQSIERPADNVYDLFQNQRDPNPPKPTTTPKKPADDADSGIKINPKKK